MRKSEHDYKNKCEQDLSEHLYYIILNLFRNLNSEYISKVDHLEDQECANLAISTNLGVSRNEYNNDYNNHGPSNHKNKFKTLDQKE